MKTLPQSLIALTVLAFCFAPNFVRAQDAPPPPPDAQAGTPAPGDDQDASFQTFYDQLGSQGSWIQTDNYGYVFQPNVSDPNWAPYTDGHWVYTDQGWAWASDEPWGWATYHYGRWANIDGTGWVWVPGYQWAPAWVSWRYGGGNCGWAPLPPETFVGAEYGDGGVNIGIGFHFGSDCDANYGIGAGCYNFLPVQYMGDPNYRGHYYDRSRNYVIINNTTNITNINVRGGGRNGFQGVNVGGPSLATVNAHSRTHVQNVRLAESNQPGHNAVNGKSFSVYAPRFNPATAQQARPTNVSRTIAQPTFNRGDNVSKPMEVSANVRAAAPSPEAVQAAQKAQASAPARAKVAREGAPIKKPLDRPLTALQPVNHATAPAANNGNPAVQHNEAAAQAKTNPAPENTSVQHHEADAAFTGGANPAPAKEPAVNYPQEIQDQQQKQAEVHPQQEAQTQHEAQPPAEHHEEAAPVQHEVQPQVEHHESEVHAAPAEAQHEVQHEAQPQVHPQAQVQHAAPPAPVHAPAAQSHPQAQGGQPGDKDKKAPGQ